MFGKVIEEKLVLYSEENQRMHTNNRLISLPRVHYYPAKPTPHKPRHWSISIEINCVRASVSMRVGHFSANI